jgi:hypothetical protein
MRTITTRRKFFGGKKRTGAFEFYFGDEESNMEN